MDPKETQEKLFSEFPPVSTAEWEEKIKADLKGADYEKKLVWKTEDGFQLKPYYRSENLEEIDWLDSIPGEYPYTRGLRQNGNDWIIRQDFCYGDIEQKNKMAREAIEKGTGATGFCVHDITAHKQIRQLLDGIDLTKTAIHFTGSRSYPLTLELFLYEIRDRHLNSESIKGSLNFDPISYLLLNGRLYVSWENNVDEAVYMINTVRKRLPGFRTITINGHYFRSAGSTIVQELAFSLASANEYLSSITGKGIDIDTVAPLMQLSLASGSSFFPEIAKLRAARMLWSTMIRQYNPKEPLSEKIFIHSATDRWNNTITDPYVNMLRTTTESMSAALGNADSISVLPFDTAFREPDDFSERIARNQQLILKDEAYLDKVADPSGGSYYIENLTSSIAYHAWELFRNVEEKGGILECIKSGFIQDEIEKAAEKKQQDLSLRKMVLVGTNQYPNTTEEVPVVKDEHPGEDKPSDFRKLKLHRAAEIFEQIRMTTEAHLAEGKKRPSVFLMSLGNPAMRKARAMFATNFFGCAGFEILEPPAFCSSEEGVSAAIASGAEIVVICSSDEEYATFAVEAAPMLKKEKPGIIVIVAGYPKELIENLKTAGVDDFIHVKSDLPGTLQKYQKMLFEK